jgi:xylan 1,4-beta-xylosidase
MFSMMGGERLAVRSSGEVPLAALLKDGVRAAPDVAAAASREGRRLCILIWHYHDDDVPGPDAAVTLTVSGLRPGAGSVRLAAHYRIDSTHSNGFAAWQRMGSPPQPTAEQFARLEADGRLQTLDAPATVRVENGAATLKFDLPRQAVSLVVLESN